MKDLKALKDLVDALKNAEVEEKMKKAEKKVIISIDENATDDCGCVGVELCNVNNEAELALASGAILATCLEKAGEENFERTLLLIFFLATKVFKSSPEETLKNESECLQMLDKIFGLKKKEDKED